MDAQKIHLAEMIDNWVLDIARHSDNEDHVDEQILENMYDYMASFKQLLDTCTKLEMTLLTQRYDGFYRFANLLERLAQAIQDGVITVPEDAPMPPGWPEPPQKQKKRTDHANQNPSATNTNNNRFGGQSVFCRHIPNLSSANWPKRKNNTTALPLPEASRMYWTIRL